MDKVRKHNSFKTYFFLNTNSS